MGSTAELDEDLVDGLKAAKSKRCYFVLVFKGGAGGALLVSKSKIGAPAIAEAKKNSGGSAALIGFVSYVDGSYLFETAKIPPATAAAAAKTVAKRDAGMSITAEFRLSTDPELLAADGGSTTSATATAKPEPDGAAVMKRLNAMTADIMTAFGGPNKDVVRSRFATANDQLKSKDFAAASKTLDELERLVKARSAASGKTDQAAANPSEAAYQARVKALTPDLKEAIASGAAAGSEAKLRFNESQVFFRKNDFAQAISLLGVVEEQIKKALAGGATSKEADGAKDASSTDTATKDQVSPEAKLSAAYQARVNALTDGLKKAIASGTAAGNEAKLRFGESQIFFRKQDFAKAMPLLDAVEVQIKQALAGPAVKSAAQAKPAETPKTGDRPPANAAAAYQARVKALTDDLKKAITSNTPAGNEAKLRFSESQVAFRKQDFAGAMSLLEAVEDQIKQALGGGASAGLSDEEFRAFQARWTSIREEWRAASDTVDKQIDQLRQALMKSDDEDMQDIAEFGLKSMTGNFSVPLLGAMLELDGATAADVKARASKVRATATAFQAHLAKENKKVEACDANPFGVDVTIGDLLVPALAEVGKSLATIGA